MRGALRPRSTCCAGCAKAGTALNLGFRRCSGRRSRLCPSRFQVQDMICKFSKKGLTPSQIGVLLRDNHGIAQVSTVTGSKVLRILKGQGARTRAWLE